MAISKAKSSSLQLSPSLDSEERQFLRHDVVNTLSTISFEEQTIQNQLLEDQVQAEVEAELESNIEHPITKHARQSPAESVSVPATRSDPSVLIEPPKKRRGRPPKDKGLLAKATSKAHNKQPSERPDVYDIPEVESEENQMPHTKSTTQPLKHIQPQKKKLPQAPIVASKGISGSHQSQNANLAAAATEPPPQTPPQLSSQPPSQSRLVPQSQSRLQPELQRPLPTKPQPRSEPAAENYTSYVRDFEEMIRILKRVGCKYTRKTNRSEPVYKHLKVKTSQGKRLARRLRALVTAYKSVQMSIEMGSSTEEAHGTVKSVVTSIMEESDAILINRLGTRQEGNMESTRIMLTDLYFILLPQFVEAIKLGVETYDSSMSYDTLCDLAELVDLLYELVSEALQQPKTHQPLSPREAYQTKKPVEVIFPIIREVRTKFRIEIKERKGHQKQAKEAKARKERIQLKRARAAEEYTQNKMKRALQGDQFRGHEDEMRQFKRQRLADPYRGTAKRDGFDRKMVSEALGCSEWQRSNTKTSAEAKNSGPRKNIDVEDDFFANDPFAEDGFERVSVFQANTRKIQKPMPLSAADQGTFIQIMSTRRGEDRFELAANRLNRPIEEIFEFAKGMQCPLSIYPFLIDCMTIYGTFKILLI